MPWGGGLGACYVKVYVAVWLCKGAQDGGDAAGDTQRWAHGVQAAVATSAGDLPRTPDACVVC